MVSQSGALSGCNRHPLCGQFQTRRRVPHQPGEAHAAIAVGRCRRKDAALAIIGAPRRYGRIVRRTYGGMDAALAIIGAPSLASRTRNWRRFDRQGEFLDWAGTPMSSAPMWVRLPSLLIALRLATAIERITHASSG